MFGELGQPSVLVLGLGESGLAAARWCVRFGCRVKVADTREAPPMAAQLAAEVPRAAFVGGALTPALLDGVALVVISPGLAPSDPQVAPLLAAAAERSLPVWGEIELFAQALAQLQATSGYAPQVLAITGTNGKTTTTRLTALLCERAGKKVAVAGNISPSALDALAAAIDAAALPEIWVLELSSFQLATTLSLAPVAATVLNVTQDHLDWHGTLDDYAAAKARIFAAGTVRVLNRDDARVAAMTADGETVRTFGLQAPVVDGDFGLVREGGIDWLAVAQADDDEPQKGRRKAVDAEPKTVRVVQLMPVDALQIRGRHNAANAMAALALARAAGLPLNRLLHGLRSYKGEPHRVQHVATVAEIDYVDDSKGTNVGATVAALEGLSRPVVLIAGGDGKGQDFSPLAAAVRAHGRAVMLIGRDAPALRAALAETGVPLVDCASLEAAVVAATERAQAGDVVLLSPACASLDMFRNYAHRAEVFVDAVRALALDQGVML